MEDIKVGIPSFGSLNAPGFPFMAYTTLKDLGHSTWYKSKPWHYLPTWHPCLRPCHAAVVSGTHHLGISPWQGSHEIFHPLVSLRESLKWLNSVVDTKKLLAMGIRREKMKDNQKGSKRCRQSSWMILKYWKGLSKHRWVWRSKVTCGNRTKEAHKNKNKQQCWEQMHITSLNRHQIGTSLFKLLGMFANLLSTLTKRVGSMGPLTMVRSWTGRPWQASVRSPKRLEKTSADAGFRG